MPHFLTELCSFFLVVIYIFILVQFYRALKFISSPKTYKGKILCGLISLCITSLIADKLDRKFDGFNPEWLANHFVPYTLTAGSITILIFLYIIYKIYNKYNKKYSLNQLDRMEGHDFEYACADILRANGFKSVTVTQGSGDYGVDITAQKKGLKYAVQCKRYSHKLDNTPIQEVIGGLAYYGCNKGAVMTNQTFTEPAKRLAEVNGIELWDRAVISRMIAKTKKDKKTIPHKSKKHTVFPSMTVVDEKTIEAIKIISEYRNADILFLQRKLVIGNPHAERILTEIESLGLIGPLIENKREIYITADDFQYLDIKYNPSA